MLSSTSDPRVQLPSWEPHSVPQTVVGRESPVSADLEEFLGIPYGSVAARWEQSQIRARLPHDIFDATKHGPKCPQPSAPNTSRTFQSYLPFPDVAESEFDCLHLSVVRPSAAALTRHGITTADNETRLPVLVWIHGGGLAFGASSDPMWDPARLVLRALHRGTPIVAVSINYRLNVFGFAAAQDLIDAQGHQEHHNSDTAAGLNFGLRDQKIGLAWVTRNIAAFGGDPDRVTVGGQSAGSVSVHAHLLEATAAAAASKAPLFRRALMHSGAFGTLGPVPLHTADASWQRLLSSALTTSSSSPPSTPTERVQLLQQVSAPVLLEMAAGAYNDGFLVAVDGVTVLQQQQQQQQYSSYSLPDVDLGPVDLRYLPRKTPERGIDVLIGITDAEASIFLRRLPTWDRILSAFEAAYSDAHQRAEVMRAYGLSASATAAELRQGLVAFLNEAVFEIPAYHARTALLAKSGSPGVGHVQSFHVATGNPFPGPFEGVAHHCVELIYLFEAFHTALAEADRGIRRPYAEPTQTAAVPTEEPETSGGDGGPEYKRTNIELCHEMQDSWLDFITADDDAGWKPIGGPDSVIVYGNNRSTEIQSLADAAWQQRIRRWDLLAANPSAMGQLAQTIDS